MILNKQDVHPDIECLSCHDGFDIETSYEESIIECGGHWQDCPSCGYVFLLREPNITWEVEEIIK